MKRRLWFASLAATAGAICCGCGDDASDGSGSGGESATAATGATATAGAVTSNGSSSAGGSGQGGDGAGGASSARTLVSTDWMLAPGTEEYRCTYLTLDEDVWVTEFHPVIPLGTHHTVVTLVPGGTDEDGTRECDDPFEGGPRQIYGTGVGTQSLVLPEGVAVKLPAGEQLVLNLHLFNATPDDLSGTSAIEIVTADEADVEVDADMEIWGQTELDIAPNGVTTVSASCTIANDLSLFGVQPHMHTLGRHLTFTHTPQGGSPTVLFDEDYDFDAQRHEDYQPAVELLAGDTVDIECTYDNPTNDAVGFGESTDDEMCFAGLWVYPAGEAFCTF